MNSMKKQIKIFTDGASRGNPGRGGWGTIIVFPAGKTMIVNDEKRMMNDEWVQELGGREIKTTNNRMELTAVIKALEFVSKKIAISHSSFLIHLNTDSSYVLKGATTWIHSWQKSGWKTANKKEVLNKDLWVKLGKLLPEFQINWKLVKGHTGVRGNERCDDIATSFALGRGPKLYYGILQNYRIDLSVPSQSGISTDRKPRTKKGIAYSYVSLVGGIIKTHRTWADCEKRVKGKSGARFKKSHSLDDEENIKAQWAN